jgi:predicted transposase/invertase (TIGR01784 family)
MAEIINPHDKFFKEALTQPGAALVFLRDYLPPEVAAHLDLTHLQLVKDSFIDETLQEHFSDLVYEVGLRNAGRAYICVLFEHKSYVDSLSALQVLRYMVQGWEYSLRQQARLWPVIPVVVYHGAVPWRVATNFQALFELPAALGVYVPEFEYLLTDLSTYSDEELKRTAELGVGLLVLKHIFRPDLHMRLPEVLSLWYTMRQQEHALRYLEAIIRYVTAAGQHVKAEDVQAALNAVTPEGDAMIGSIAQEWIRQGEQRGEQHGEQRGLRLGLLDGIELGLELRFGLEGLRLLPEIAQIEDTYVLKAVHEAIRSVTRPEELRQFYAAGGQ